MSKRVIFAGRISDLDLITDFCRAVYARAFTQEEAKRRFKELTFESAVALWRAGLPDSGKN